MFDVLKAKPYPFTNYWGFLPLEIKRMVTLRRAEMEVTDLKPQLMEKIRRYVYVESECIV